MCCYEESPFLPKKQVQLPESVQSQIRLFAGDFFLYRSIRNFGDHVKLQQNLNNLNIWTDKWGMTFNLKKVLPSQCKTKVLMNRHILKQVEEIPFFGYQFLR